jgi:hypothetical protein
MGRYYSGDIEGKFWFAVQGSDASERFGGTKHEPQYTEYEFNDDDLDKVELEITAIENNLGPIKGLFDEFFDANSGYNNDKLMTFFTSKGENLTHDKLKKYLSDYADLGLGIQIRDCIKENEGCNFQADC